MLKIKMIMAALLAIAFASSTFAGDEGDASTTKVDAPAASTAKAGKVSPKGSPKGSRSGSPKPAKWSANECAEKCTKVQCKGLTEDSDSAATPTPAQSKKGLARAFECAENCKAPGKARTMGDCLPGVYKATGCTLPGNKRADDCKKLSNGMSAVVMDGYENRDNSNDAPAQAFWAAVKGFDVISAG